MAKINLLGVLGQIRKADGALNNGGLVEVYVAGTSFSTPYISFKDSALTINNTHPVVLDSSGYADIWVQGDVDVIAKDSSGTTIRSKLGANPEQASGSSLLGTPNSWTALQTFSAGLTLPVGQTATMSGTLAGDTTLTGIKTYDGLQRFDIGATFTVVSTGATVDLETATGNTINITGNAVAATIVSFNNSAREGLTFDVLFSISSGDLTLIHGANLNLPTSANIVVTAGDRCRLVKTGPTTWTVMEYQRLNGTPLAILDNSVTTTKIADSNVTTAKIADAAITFSKLASTGGSNIQIISTAGAGTYTTPTGAIALLIIGQGAGGGGGGGRGGVDADGGGGGGSGSSDALVIVSPAASYSYTVGAGGTGGIQDAQLKGGNGGQNLFNSLPVGGGGVGGEDADNSGISAPGGAGIVGGKLGGAEIGQGGFVGGVSQLSPSANGGAGGILGGGGGGGSSAFGQGGTSGDHVALINPTDGTFGSGGGGGYFNSNGAAGGAGVLIVIAVK